MAKPVVLLSNDDGYRARGIQEMRRALSAHFEVILCAPENEQSASSHALSLNRPLRLENHGDGVYSVDGTPADSVYVALHAEGVLPQKPAVVVSGMNHGLNLGQDVFYSGTVAAAREGALQGFKALAFSTLREDSMTSAVEDAAELVLRALSMSAPSLLLNVNYPPGEAWARRLTSTGRRVYTGGLVGRVDPRGRPYYWIGGDTVSHEGDLGTDTAAYDAGIVGVTPLGLDLTAPASAVELTDLTSLVK